MWIFNGYITDNGLNEYWISLNNLVKVHPPGTKNNNSSWIVIEDGTLTTFSSEQETLKYLIDRFGEIEFRFGLGITFLSNQQKSPKTPTPKTSPTNVKNRKISL